jgi:hypothetical protein
MKNYGVKPEIEAFDLSMIFGGQPAKSGKVNRRCVQFVMR